MRVRIKICGITNFEDALKACSLGIDVIGFNFYKKSSRYILPSKAREISLKLPPFISVVGVFVNEKIEKIRKITSECFLSAVQLHGDETPEFVEKLNLPVIKAFRIKGEKDTEEIRKYTGKVKAFLLDTYVKGEFGGTGKNFNWEIARKVKKFNVPVILAGGINPLSVKDAIKEVKPFAIDVASGVERKPGIKDFHLMKELVNKVKEIENELS